MARIGKEREESGMVGHARMNGRMNHCILFYFYIEPGKRMKNGAVFSGNDLLEE